MAKKFLDLKAVRDEHRALTEERLKASPPRFLRFRARSQSSDSQALEAVEAPPPPPRVLVGARKRRPVKHDDGS